MLTGKLEAKLTATPDGGGTSELDLDITTSGGKKRASSPVTATENTPPFTEVKTNPEAAVLTNEAVKKLTANESSLGSGNPPN